VLPKSVSLLLLTIHIKKKKKKKKDVLNCVYGLNAVSTSIFEQRNFVLAFREK